MRHAEQRDGEVYIKDFTSAERNTLGWRRFRVGGEHGKDPRPVFVPREEVEKAMIEASELRWREYYRDLLRRSGY